MKPPSDSQLEEISETDPKSAQIEDKHPEEPEPKPKNVGGKETGGYTCSLCGLSGIKDNFNLGRHISRMHSGSFKCVICKVEFDDRHRFNIHYKDCYHFCPFEGCSFREKRQSRMDGHVRKHSRMN